MANRDIVVVGGSAGGLEAAATLLAQFPPDLPAAVLLVLHVMPDGPAEYVRLLDRGTPLPVRMAVDGGPIYHGNVYVAPPDHHLLVEASGMRVARGPRENRSRPAIDPLFRSAALVHGSRVIGVLLTGHLDDGVAGLAAIQQAGGLAIVQDPRDAEVADMPAAALHRMDVDYCLPLHRMGAAIMRALTSETPTRTSTARTGALQKEIAIAAGEKVKLDEQEQLGVPAAMGCPECGGPLSRIDDPSITRFRCHVGHGYTARALLTDQSEQVERALGAAMRTLEERARLLADLAESTGSGASTTQAEALWKRVAEARAHAETLRQLLLAGVREDAA